MRLDSDPSTAAVAELIRRGLSLEAVATALTLHRSAVYRRARAAGVKRRWTRLTAKERQAIRALLLADLSRREVARRTGRGLGTVARLGAAMQTKNSVHRTRRPWRCPTCGARLQIRPCLRCQATALLCPRKHAV
jgi:transposase